jgi:hypothetical protein
MIRNLLRPLRLLEQQAVLIERQNAFIQLQNRQIQQQQLEHARDLRGIVAAWLINLEQPEIDVRQDLAEFDTVLGHRIASIEEHIL